VIGEPSTPLWSAVKALYDSWPPDSEDNASELGRVLQGLGETATMGGDSLRGTAHAVGDVWHDEAGGVLVDKIGANAGAWANVGGDAEHLAGVAQQYAAELTTVKQTIVSVIARNETRYEQLLFSSPAMAMQFAAAIADYLRKLVGGEVPASTSKPGLLDRLRSAAGKLFNDAWTLAFGPGTGGPTIGEGISLPVLGPFGGAGGLSAAIVRDQKGHFYIVNSASLGGAITPDAGAFAGIGVTKSTAHDANEMGGLSYHAGGSVSGEVVGGSVSVDKSASGSAISGTGLVGVGTPGIGVEGGLSTSKVIPLTPGNLIHEGTMIGQLLTSNPMPFIMDTLGWGK